MSPRAGPEQVSPTRSDLNPLGPGQLKRDPIELPTQGRMCERLWTLPRILSPRVSTPPRDALTRSHGCVRGSPSQSSDDFGPLLVPAEHVAPPFPLRESALLRYPTSLTEAGVTQLVECQLPKLNVAGSNPVARSNTTRDEGMS